MFCLYKTELPTSTKTDDEKIGNRGKGTGKSVNSAPFFSQSDKVTLWEIIILLIKLAIALPSKGFLS